MVLSSVALMKNYELDELRGSTAIHILKDCGARTSQLEDMDVGFDAHTIDHVGCVAVFESKSVEVVIWIVRLLWEELTDKVVSRRLCCTTTIFQWREHDADVSFLLSSF